MSVLTTKPDSLQEQQIKSEHDHTSTIDKSTEMIRQRVEDRHWQLFEARLKKQLPKVNKENYTNPNDYRIIDRLKKVDQPQPPIEPHQRWEIFCNQITNKSNETNRLMSIFHHVWLKNWNTKRINEIEKRFMTDPTLNKNIFLNFISTNNNDQKIISSILHRTTSSDKVSTDKYKKYVI
ncbi:unnamed protein product [Rotaria sordida]|uniref:Uncharacterized protein n=1 Tax=Rotaria sordida TaxID=392033 RepID=A0A818NZ50_9BILA|nr:unnamed protein product [Rotaria sordida]CAF0912671.1 unnamed protein product [Rotaria sordida]CAF0929355.1 unnamed protein product [Rotaria sordida]CAF0954631.1 unnamed protein product [Rotaria sordida]CAF3519895.1 unnamed protein product [Rotaria sordida]